MQFPGIYHRRPEVEPPHQIQFSVLPITPLFSCVTLLQEIQSTEPLYDFKYFYVIQTIFKQIYLTNTWKSNSYK